jgi:isopentenyl-diphosphate delta-isomerase type 1
MNAIELFDIVDEDDRVIGQAPRSACHGNPALIHRVAHVLLFDSRNRLLLQKRSQFKDIQPGRWDTSVGGHLDPGENYQAAAYREMREELGITGVPLTFLYTSKIRNAVESENVATYLARFDGAIAFPLEEIEEVRFWAEEEIAAQLGSGIFTPNFEEEWALWRQWCRRYPTAGGERMGVCAGDTFPDLFREISPHEEER